MKKIFFIILCVLYITSITVCMSCGNWQDCPNFIRKNPHNRWCNCGNNNDITKPPKPKPKPPLPDEPVDDPCDPYNPPVPNFSRPGQRISKTKCHEYLWQIRVRIERDKRKQQCKDKKPKAHRFKREIQMNLTTETLDRIFSESVVPHPEKKKPQITLFIIGGRDSLPNEFPHMGAIGWKSSEPNRDWKFMCGSTLISPKFALTAGHCSSANPRDTTIADIVPKIIRFGVEDIVALDTGHTAEDRVIANIIRNPNYHPPQQYYDAALFELDRPITFNKFVQPACLWTEDLKKVKNGTVTGWGVTQTDAHEGHPYLQAAELEVIDSQLCDNLLWIYHSRRWHGLEDHQFCAGQMAGGVDACQGDSGGPFQVKIPLPARVSEVEGTMYYVVGVTSFGLGCGKRDVPGIYIKVSNLLDWIEPIVWP